MTSWFQIVELEEKPNVYDNDAIAIRSEHNSNTDQGSEEADVLKLNYSDSDLTRSSSVSDHDVEFLQDEPTYATGSKTIPTLGTGRHRVESRRVRDRNICYKRSTHCTMKSRNKRKRAHRVQQEGSQPPPLTRFAKQVFPDDARRSWNVRWVRNGFEDVVYYVCNCNEAPNVVFATLCFQQSSRVYTMVLRNCNCKRRYWYDKSAAKQTSRRVGDFERAITCRAKAIGRSWSAPGYDLASFVLQHVATDKRSVIRRRSSDASIVLVTTADMLQDLSIRGQLLYEPSGGVNAGGGGNQRPEPCAVCGTPSSIVTEDSACIPTFTCWQHSSSQLAATGCNRTRLHGATVVDLQFLRKDPNDGLVCRLRLVRHDPTQRGGVGVLTVAELVSLPHGVHPFELENQNHTDQDCTGERKIDVESAHSECCRDDHRNDEDLFPSMTIDGFGGGSPAGCVKHYDTTIGRVLDKLNCTASKFQKL